MDVLIRDFKMPKNCDTCTFLFLGSGGRCFFSGCKCLKSKRPNDCPLVEVKPHGRLIDADEHMRVLEQMSKDAVDDVQRESFAMAHMLICHAPTVLEANND